MSPKNISTAAWIVTIPFGGGGGSVARKLRSSTRDIALTPRSGGRPRVYVHCTFTCGFRHHFPASPTRPLPPSTLPPTPSRGGSEERVQCPVSNVQRGAKARITGHWTLDSGLTPSPYPYATTIRRGGATANEGRDPALHRPV